MAQAEPVSRDQAAAGVGVPRHTAKFHLDRLVEEGLLDTEFRRLAGRRARAPAGRPSSTGAPSREVSVTLPERRYDLAGADPRAGRRGGDGTQTSRLGDSVASGRRGRRAAVVRAGSRRAGRAR